MSELIIHKEKQKIKFENGLSSLLFLTMPVMFDMPFHVKIGFIILTISSVLFHMFPTNDLFGIMDTSSVIYVCSIFIVSNPLIALSIAILNILEKLFINRNSPFVLMFTWIYTFIFCTISFNIYTLIPILFSSLFYHYTYFINKSEWDNRVRLLWHYYNSLYISINIPYRFSQDQKIIEFSKQIIEIKNKLSSTKIRDNLLKM